MKFLALIPARKGSKSIKNKNFKKFNSKPLIWWTIKSSKKSKFIDKIVVSTDCKKIKNFSIKNKVEVPFLRPKKISNDKSTAKQVIDHTLKYYKKKKYHPDVIIYLQPTSPLRETIDIDNCCKIFLKYKPDILLSVNKLEHQKNPEGIFQMTKKNFLKKISKKKFVPLRQKKKIYFAQNGPAILMIKCKNILKRKLKIVGYKMDKLKSLDIDDKIDFKLSEIIQRKFKYN